MSENACAKPRGESIKTVKEDLGVQYMRSYIALIFLSLTTLANSYAYSLSDFENTRAKFLAIYSPIVKSETNLNLEIKLDEEVKNYFGGMSADAETMKIIMGSEFDREKGVTPDFYAFILCHEVGHLLGGLPKKETRGKGALYSSEGQSDYFASSVCLKKIFLADDGPLTPVIVTDHIASLCKTTSGSQEEEEVCKRTANAGREFFEYLKIMYREYGIDFVTPDMDTPEADGMSIGSQYPSFQCRLDTIIAGATGRPRPHCWWTAVVF